MAVQELYPGTQVTIGPAIEDGFYYDFARAEPFTPDDLPKIEAKMHEIVKQARPTRREVWPRDKAVQHFQDIGESYKAELIASIPANEDVSIYWHGDWHDLCRGPHFRTTADIGDAFKLTKISGAYWRGDAKNAQLQRIYGTAWRDKKELDAYLTRMEEAEKRDHRKMGREMDLFHLQEEAVGQVFWHPKGMVFRRTLENHIRRRKSERPTIRKSKTPLLIDRKLWEQSGHWEELRPTCSSPSRSRRREHILAVKPMNCPGHVQIFKQGTKSYRELPLRMAEFGSCHRYEPSGALHGIMRVRGFVQDDAHIFCTEDQIVGRDHQVHARCCGSIASCGLQRTSSPSWRPARKSAAEPTTGNMAEAALAKACEKASAIPMSTRAKAPSMPPSWNSCCATPSAATAMRHHPARLPGCPTAGRQLYRRGRQPKHPVMLHRAITGSHGTLHRRVDRALCRQVPALAGAGAGPRHPDQRQPTPMPRRWWTRCAAPVVNGTAGLRVDIDTANER